jgi:hypothetical protein
MGGCRTREPMTCLHRSRGRAVEGPACPVQRHPGGVSVRGDRARDLGERLAGTRLALSPVELVASDWSFADHGQVRAECAPAGGSTSPPQHRAEYSLDPRRLAADRSRIESASELPSGTPEAGWRRLMKGEPRPAETRPTACNGEGPCGCHRWDPILVVGTVLIGMTVDGPMHRPSRPIPNPGAAQRMPFTPVRACFPVASGRGRGSISHRDDR